MKVLIIDIDTFSRRGIEHLIAKEISGVEIISVSGFEGSLKLVRQNKIKLVVADLYHPDTDIKEAFNFLNSIKVPVIVYTVFETPGYIKAILRTIRNEDLFVSKKQPLDDFLFAIKKISLGKYTSNYIKLKPREFSPELMLSIREREMVVELLKGKTLADISIEKGIRYASLITMRKNIFEKCKINSLIDLFYYAKIYDL